MPNPYKILKESFAFNILVARAMIHMAPYEDRKTLMQWIDKLSEPCSTPKQVSFRNEYAWYLVIMLQSGTIGPPFNTSPPHTDIKELSKCISDETYKSLMESSLESYDLTQQLKQMKEKSNAEDDGEKKEGVVKNGLKLDPSEFFDWQPTPKNGTICYVCAFSNYDD